MWLEAIKFTVQIEANHNKDYSVVKTFKAGQLAFFMFNYFSTKKAIRFHRWLCKSKFSY